jgi:hypothetical protein
VTGTDYRTGRLLAEPFEAIYTVRGVAFPTKVRFRQIVIVGPPGTGKSTLLTQVGGWPDEGYVDLTSDRWWASKSLAIRPRQVHVGLPFVGFPHGQAVYDRSLTTNGSLPEIEFSRIRLPAPPRFFFSMDWRRKYVFEFLLPPAEVTFAQREARARVGSHAVDQGLSFEMVRNETKRFWQLAAFLKEQGFMVYVRRASDGLPERIIGPTEANR